MQCVWLEVYQGVFHFGVAEQVPYSWKSVNWEDTTISQKKPSQNASSYLGDINHAQKNLQIQKQSFSPSKTSSYMVLFKVIQ